MRVAVVDIGTNSTRLLVADVEGTTVSELDRRSTVTRLGEGVATTGELGRAPMDRVHAALTTYKAVMDEHAVTRNVAVLTSAVRDAANGAAFTREVRDRYGLDAREIPGEEEARLSFLGATSERDDDPTEAVVVVDIGGGSTEFVVGQGGAVRFDVSTQAGVVRHGERHVHHDPPQPDELDALARDARAVYADAIPDDVAGLVRHGIAVAGTATSAAAIDLGTEPYDPKQVHGHRIDAATLDGLVARLSALTEDERHAVPGLHPDRARTIVPGVVLLREALRRFGLGAFEVSEHDILRGAAISLATSG